MDLMVDVHPGKTGEGVGQRRLHVRMDHQVDALVGRHLSHRLRVRRPRAIDAAARPRRLVARPHEPHSLLRLPFRWQAPRHTPARPNRRFSMADHGQ